LKIATVAKVDAYIETCVDLASQLELPVLNKTVKNHGAIERSYIKCGPFSTQ
jgi:predicted small secreted protein